MLPPIAVGEGTFGAVAVAVAEEAIERMDCWVDSIRPMLPYLHLLEAVVAVVAVHQRDH